jgi:hypothetical protein
LTPEEIQLAVRTFRSLKVNKASEPPVSAVDLSYIQQAAIKGETAAVVSSSDGNKRQDPNAFAFARPPCPVPIPLADFSRYGHDCLNGNLDYDNSHAGRRQQVPRWRTTPERKQPTRREAFSSAYPPVLHLHRDTFQDQTGFGRSKRDWRRCFATGTLETTPAHQGLAGVLERARGDNG